MKQLTSFMDEPDADGTPDPKARRGAKTLERENRQEVGEPGGDCDGVAWRLVDHGKLDGELSGLA